MVCQGPITAIGACDDKSLACAIFILRRYRDKFVTDHIYEERHGGLFASSRKLGARFNEAVESQRLGLLRTDN